MPDANDIAFIPSDPVTYLVNGKEMQFHPLSVGTALKLRSLAKPITLALSVLFQNTNSDVAKDMEEFVNTQEGMTSNKTKIQAVSPDMARFRSEQRERAFAGLVDALTDKANLDALTEIIMDSLRIPSPRVIVTFQKDLDIATFIELIKGVVEGNKRVFGPLALKVTDAMRGMISQQPLPQASPASNTPQANESGASGSSLRAVPASQPPHNEE